MLTPEVLAELERLESKATRDWQAFPGKDGSLDWTPKKAGERVAACPFVVSIQCGEGRKTADYGGFLIGGHQVMRGDARNWYPPNQVVTDAMLCVYLRNHARDLLASAKREQRLEKALKTIRDGSYLPHETCAGDIARSALEESRD
jgi:hypothetical protein